MLQDMLAIVRLARGNDNRPVHEQMLEDHAINVEMEELVKEDGGNNA